MNLRRLQKQWNALGATDPLWSIITLPEKRGRKWDPGVDIALSMVRHAERFNRHGARCHYHLNATGDLGLFEPDRFDFVYTTVTLQHMEPRYAKRYVLRGVLPGPVLTLYRTLRRVRRWRSRKPSMEMHGILKPAVIELLESHGGIVVDVQPDTWATGWTGFRYCVTKR